MTMHHSQPATAPLRPDVMLADVTPERRVTLLAALRSARHFGVDCEEEGFLLDHLIDTLAEDADRGGDSLCVADLVDEYFGDMHPVQWETPYWVQARDTVVKLCRSNLTM